MAANRLHFVRVGSTPIIVDTFFALAGLVRTARAIFAVRGVVVGWAAVDVESMAAADWNSWLAPDAAPVDSALSRFCAPDKEDTRLPKFVSIILLLMKKPFLPRSASSRAAVPT